jgi:hypothetical protein
MTVSSMESGDVIVYGVAGGTHYIARFDEGGWLTWPATAGGWNERKAGRERDVDTSRELDPFNARLALRLSGVTT